MTYPIVEVITSDNLRLNGIINKPNNGETLYLHIHGTGSNFYCEAFYPAMHQEIPQICDLLITNNRGSYALDSWQDTGAALEIFEDCRLDIDAWIEWGLSNGYKEIILSGHSHGTEKVVYYMTYGKYTNLVKGVILMGFADSYGNQMAFEENNNLKLMAEAQDKVLHGKGYELLTTHRRSQAGELPISAQTYINYFSPDSALSKVLPFRNRSLPMYQNIHIPILATIGDHDEYAIIPIKEALELLLKENPLTNVKQFIGSGHCYEGYEKEVAHLICEFISNL